MDCGLWSDVSNSSISQIGCSNGYNPGWWTLNWSIRNWDSRIECVSDRKQQRCRLHETLYVPRLSHNLLSVFRTTWSGKSFTLADSCCQLLDRKQRIAASGSKVGNVLFELYLSKYMSERWYERDLWSYASHIAQCGMSTSNSTCRGCCVWDYHIYFGLLALSSPSVPTLCLKDPRWRLTQFSRIFFWRSGDTSG